MKRHNDFSEFIQDASSPLPKKNVDEICDMLKSGEISGYDLKLICNTVNEMYATARMMQDIRQTPKITIFGSARTKPDHPDYKLCVALSKLMADMGYMVITGAGPGIMTAGHEGAGPNHAIGVSIVLPFEEKANEVVKQSNYLITYRYFFSRKLTFVREADAIVLFPGGFGTMDEAFEALCLMHTGRTMPVPLVLMEHEGSNYWEKWLKYIKEGLLETGNISPNDMYLFRRFHTAEDAMDYINNFYRRYHSMRYLNDKVVIRLNRPLPETLLKELTEEYADFLGEHGIEKHARALPEEENEPDIAHLPRLVIDANKKRPVDLYCFVRSLNRENVTSSTRRQDRPELLAPHKNPRPTRVKIANLFKKK